MTNTSRVDRRPCLPLGGGGWNATGLARQSRASFRSPTGELSPMAFLVGVASPRAKRTPPPGAPRSLSPVAGVRAPRVHAGLSDGALPSPLKGEADPLVGTASTQ